MNISSNTAPSLAEIPKESLLTPGESIGDLKPDEAGLRVCRTMRLKKEKFEKSLKKSGYPVPEFSEILLFIGNSKSRTTKAWIEPYVIDEDLARRLVWKWREKGLAGYEPEVIAVSPDDLEGKHIIEWYKNGGHIRYNVKEPPPGVESVTLDWPEAPLSDKQVEQENARKIKRMVKLDEQNKAAAASNSNVAELG